MRSRSNGNLEVLVFKERARKPEYMYVEKNLFEQGREPTTNSTHIWYQHIPGFEPGPHWWEKSALTTEPPLLSINDKLYVGVVCSLSIIWDQQVEPLKKKSLFGLHKL